ncbi:MAG: tRNA uridine-5-carboxymethylaminomethyl(34) synthesis GTPase MnmE [Crocinitomicaceae bacterium]|nr:tRNA uridine-5-carboxymethylaminomethyl(34) synthesis GTPase MnmE [Crocinitomicaceae bacterium]MDP5042082.1 tRNA uridine-5-carboxymethylaminomethyl(34) synthesis GTPase MnmE [Crocinitomicaceae bacterium]
MHDIHQDPICALATANGMGAIAVIRVSGVGAKSLVSKGFSKDLSALPSHSVHLGWMLSASGERLDEVLATLFDHGKSFTGEESVELACHGSPYIQQLLLQRLVELGCRFAEPGEFTKRAFLNGRLDLSQAEAVADLIAAQSKQAHQVALQQLRGRFSSELQQLREQLINFAALIELELDFAEEDVEFADRSALKQLVASVLQMVRRLAASFELGNAIKQGVPVAIVGAPNTGKSTLLNQLLGEERAIVSDIAGTTRDVIEEVLNIDGIQFRLIDTAGIRQTTETIEALGIERSQQKIEQAKIVLCLADSGDLNNLQETQEWVQSLFTLHPDKHILLIQNKADLTTSPNLNPQEALQISALTGTGITDLKEKLVKLVLGDFSIQDETIVSNARHHTALQLTAAALDRAQSGLEGQTTADFIAMDIREAMRQLGHITGQIDIDTDILGTIFSKFCIGK